MSDEWPLDWTPSDGCSFAAWEALATLLSGAGVRGLLERLSVMRAIVDNPEAVLSVLGMERIEGSDRWERVTP